MSELSAVLDELDGWLAVEKPDLYPRLRPGLSEQEVEDLEARLAPYRLPAELVTVYRWHDGWEEHRDGSFVPLLPDCAFNSLREAIDQYDAWCGLIPEMDDIWNPLWFPAFGGQSGEFVELQPERDLPAGLLWSFHSHDGQVHASYDSVTSLFRTSLEVWRAGLMPDAHWPEVRLRVAAENPVAQQPDGYSRLTRSTAPTFDWPESWLIAAGVAFPHPADDQDVITIAQLLADPWCERPVRGTFRTAMSSGAWETGTLSDETGSIKVFLERELTENYRLFMSSNRFEMIVRPVTDGDTVDESMAGCEFDSELEQSLTRRFLDASAASFDAIRVVPLPQVTDDAA